MHTYAQAHPETSTCTHPYIHTPLHTQVHAIHPSIHPSISPCPPLPSPPLPPSTAHPSIQPASQPASHPCIHASICKKARTRTCIHTCIYTHICAAFRFLPKHEGLCDGNSFPMSQQPASPSQYHEGLFRIVIPHEGGFPKPSASEATSSKKLYP